LGFTGISAVIEPGLSSRLNPAAHGLTEIQYAFTSGAGNNGSAFAGLNANTPWYNTTIGLAMLFGRFFVIIPALALAGNLAAKKRVAETTGTFPTTGGLWVGLLVGVILIVGALTFFPSFALGPVIEHFQMNAGDTFAFGS
jgi:K+-transporting ATPase ATPase A chain